MDFDQAVAADRERVTRHALDRIRAIVQAAQIAATQILVEAPAEARAGIIADLEPDERFVFLVEPYTAWPGPGRDQG